MHNELVIEVRDGGKRRIDRVLGGSYLAGIGEFGLATLRERRDEATQEETDLSYLRRLLHARIDIVEAEQRSRADGGRTHVLDQLATILADNALAPAGNTTRHRFAEPSRAGVYRRQAEALAGNSDLSDVTSLTDAALDSALRTYREQEESVSARRREVQRVVDTLGSEIADRYAHGHASVDELIGRQQVENQRAASQQAGQGDEQADG